MNRRRSLAGKLSYAYVYFIVPFLLNFNVTNSPTNLGETGEIVNAYV